MSAPRKIMGGSGQSISFWRATAKEREGGDRIRDGRFDVCVVGAGIAGLTTAYLLAREGKSVIVLDDGPIGGGETERTTAHLSSVIDDRFYKLERIHGSYNARMAHQAHAAAIDKIEEIAKSEGIDCDFRRLDGYLFYAPTSPEGILDLELKAAKHIDIDVEMASSPIATFEGPCLRFGNQGQFDPLRYLHGVSDAFRQAGGALVTGAHASEIVGGEDARVAIEDGQSVSADSIVVATNAPVNDRFQIYTKQAPYRSYVIAMPVPAGSVPTALYWDTSDPYHYVRLASGDGSNDTVIVGGEDHKTGQANDAPLRYERLETWARKRFPKAGEVIHRWSGQVMETIDGLAMIGANPGDEHNVFIATGDSGMGMTHGTIAGMLLTDLIVGRKNVWADLFSPSRFPLQASSEFLKENANVAAQYVERIMPKRSPDPEKIGKDSGSVIERDGSKIALYIDAHGKEHARSAICPHRGCVVQWNSFEKTWDCPCHGSRFATDGDVLNGPSIRALPKADRSDATA